VKNNPLIEVVETPGDINFSDEIAAEMVIEAFSADPSLNAIYAQGVGQMGAVAGLRTIGRLVPFDNPDHVVMAVYDSETTVLDLMLEEEVVDCMGSLSPLQIYDLNIKALFTLAIEGNPVTKNINYDLRTITSENAHTEKMFGALLAWPLAYPMDDWDKWPILDTTEVSLPTPTILEGY